MLPDIYQHRNKEEHLVVLYCDDERVSSEAAKFLVDRGTLNVYLLTGGMIDLVQEYPEFAEGTIPYQSPPKPKQRRGDMQNSPNKNSKFIRLLNFAVCGVLFSSAYAAFMHAI